MREPDLISCTEAITLPGLLQCRMARTPDLAAYREYDARQGGWRTWTWGEMGALVGRWQQALAAETLEPGDRVAILASNGVAWVACEQAALGLGLVVVPLYVADNPGNIAYLLADSGARFLLAGKSALWADLAPLRERFPDLRTVVCLEELEAASRPVQVRPASAWLPAEAAAPRTAPPDPDALATLVYTSGTTGPPKGVMLSHRNLLWNAEAAGRIIPTYHDDVFLSFLPLSHTLERTLGYYLPMLCGSQVAYARSVNTLAEDLRTIRPTVMISVPRIYERFHRAVRAKVRERGPFAERLLDRAVAVGWRRYQHGQGRGPAPGALDRLLWPLLRRLAAAPVLERLGGRLRVAISGGGPLDESIARFFLGLGLHLLQGYGLTETSPVITANAIDDNDPFSVGFPLPGLEVRTGAAGELLVRGPSVMQGYWGRAEATREAIDGEGWLHTGDVAELRDGRIFLRGRIKDILVTSTGEKIPRPDLEAAVLRDPLFTQVLAIGEARPYVALLTVLDPEQWRALAGELGLAPDDPAALRARPVTQAVLRRVNARLQDLPGYARVRAVHLSLEPWTVEAGLLTPTLKLKRHVLEERFEEAIRGLYADHG